MTPVVLRAQEDDNNPQSPVKVAVVGAGWWAQGWHCVHLHNNPNVELVAIVDTAENPQSKLNPNLESLTQLAKKYNCRSYYSLEELFAAEEDLDGVLVCTPHSTHYELGVQVLQACTNRREKFGGDYKPIHLLMEKPMTTDAKEAENLYCAVQEYQAAGGKGTFLINHSANYQLQTKLARDLIQSGRIGTVQHVTAFFASPLKWIFDDPANVGWNEPTGNMLGNGFGWGQQTHLLAWVLHVTGLECATVYCQMTHSETTGADVAQSATITCTNGAVMSLSGTSLLPGNAHSHPPVGKRVSIEIYGSTGALFYSGVDTNPQSGRLEMAHEDGHIEVICDSFVFEALDNTGTGPRSLQSWIAACQGKQDYEQGADCAVGTRTVQAVAAMYESHVKKEVITIAGINNDKK